MALHRALALAVSSIFLVAPESSSACSLPAGTSLPPTAPVSRNEARYGYYGVGLGATAVSVTLATVLDETGRYPTLVPVLISTPLVLLSAEAMLPATRGSGECDSGFEYDEFGKRALIPLALGVIPATITWWGSGASMDASLTAQLGPHEQLLMVEARF